MLSAYAELLLPLLTLLVGYRCCYLANTSCIVVLYVYRVKLSSRRPVISTVGLSTPLEYL